MEVDRAVGSMDTLVFLNTWPWFSYTSLGPCSFTAQTQSALVRARRSGTKLIIRC